MVLAAVFSSRESLSSHPLFKITGDFQKIDSPSELGYHPDTVFSVFDYFVISLRQMPASAVFGEDFAAIRFAPLDEYDTEHAEVSCIYLRCIQKKWVMKRAGKSVSDEEFNHFTLLAQNQPVEISNRMWKRI